MGAGDFVSRIKMMAAFVLVAVLPIVVSHMLRELDGVGHSKYLVGSGMAGSPRFASYLGSVRSTVVSLAQDSETKLAISDFARNFVSGRQNETLGIEQKNIALQRDAIRRFYVQQFNAEYRQKNGSILNVEPWLQRLDSASIVGQYDFIVNNDFPMEKKYEMLRPMRETPYGDTHARYHPLFQHVLRDQGLYDVFLVDRDGRIVYSVFKEIDFATSLVSGPWVNSGLARAFEASKYLASEQTHYEDFASYIPSYDAPAAFLSTPIFQDGQYQGALVVQVSIERFARPEFTRPRSVAVFN